jgi:hypothetical protein
VEQFDRKHEPAPVVEDGAIDSRKVKESAVAERHVQSDEGFKIAERRSASVAQNRKETEKVFADRRKKSSEPINYSIKAARSEGSPANFYRV